MKQPLNTEGPNGSPESLLTGSDATQFPRIYPKGHRTGLVADPEHGFGVLIQFEMEDGTQSPGYCLSPGATMSLAIAIAKRVQQLPEFAAESQKRAANESQTS